MKPEVFNYSDYERLKAENEALNAMLETMNMDIITVKGENAELRAERDATNLTGEYATLYAENERLKKKLDELMEKIAFDEEIAEARKEFEE